MTSGEFHVCYCIPYGPAGHAPRPDCEPMRPLAPEEVNALYPDAPLAPSEIHALSGDGHDPIHHPQHYTSQVPGIEAIEVTEHFSFNLGNVIKYVWRAADKGGIDDLQKAAWYLRREITRWETDL